MIRFFSLCSFSVQVPCKNAVHRRIVHQLAEVCGLDHETVTEPNQFQYQLTTHTKQQIEHHEKKMDQSPEYHTRQIRELHESEKERIPIQSVVLSHKARQNPKVKTQTLKTVVPHSTCTQQKEESKNR